jgi:Zn-dependent peptidase ImmA (M78 family)
MGFRRGFKTEANTRALEVRAELGLGALDRFDPFVLAEHLLIPVVALSELLSTTPVVVHLLDIEPDVFSAVTVFAGTKRSIVHNDSHTPARQNSNIAHEEAHALLFHEPKPATDHRGCRHWDQDIEDEAGWLASVLLVPEDAALAIARGTWLSEDDAAVHLGVSSEMLNYRLNVSGARKRAERARQSWRPLRRN